MNTTQPAQPDPLAVKCLIDLMALNRATGSYEATFETKAHIIISNYLARARQEVDTTECDALKASNAELREQLAANAKLISELQHTLRLVQGTHAQQVRECAVKAAHELTRQYTIPLNHYHDATPLFMQIICEAFGAPVKDECDLAWLAWLKWIKSIETECHDWESFEAGWKLAKGKP